MAQFQHKYLFYFSVLLFFIALYGAACLPGEDLSQAQAQDIVYRDYEIKSYTLIDPEVGDEFGSFHHHYPVRVQFVMGIIGGESGDDVDFIMRTDSSRLATGTNLIGTQTISNRDYFHIWNAAADDTTGNKRHQIWFEIDDVTGTPDWVTIQYYYSKRQLGDDD